MQNRKIVSFGLLLFMGSPLFGQQALSAQADSWTPEPGFISLFNGEDLSGWCFRVRTRRGETKSGKVIENFDGETQSDDDHRYSVKDGVLTVSDYNIVDHTPFKRDIIEELSEACHRNGLKFGVYYSEAQDWDESDAPFIKPRFNPIRRVLHPELPDDFQPDMDRYIAKKSLPQVEELVKNYDLDLIWFDTPSGMNMDRVKQFSEMVRKHRPDCLINSRIIHSGRGKIEAQFLPHYDYVSIGDKEVPTKKLPLYVESPDSVSSSFGYKTKGECYYHSEKEMIERFVGTVCAGGNYLLNNGPMGNGQLDPEAIRLYGVIGDWLEVNGESIYETRRNPLPSRPPWGDICVSKDGKTLYLHILRWPESGSITVDQLPTQAASATYLAGGESADYVQQGPRLRITLPAKPLNEFDTVLKVECNDSLTE